MSSRNHHAQELHKQATTHARLLKIVVEKYSSNYVNNM